MQSLSARIAIFRQLPALDRAQMVLSTLIKLTLLAAIPLALLEGEWMTAFVSIAALAAALLPWFLARSYHFYIPVGFEFIIVLFVYMTLFLGEVHGFYTRFWWWDVVLHTGSGIASGFIGFLILYSLYRSGRLQATPSLIAVFAFSVSLAIGVLWEIFEYGMDSFFGLNMQKSGLVDTMWDLIVNTLGAFVAAVSGWAYIRFRGKGPSIFRYYIESFFKLREEGPGAPTRGETT